MEIKGSSSGNSNPIANEAAIKSQQAREQLDFLLAHQIAYFDTFRSKIGNADIDRNTYNADFLELNILLGNLEAEAQKSREGIKALSGIDPNQTQTFKSEYDSILEDLFNQMKALIDQTIPGLRDNLVAKVRQMTGLQFSPANTIDLNNCTQQLNLIVTEVNEQVRRVQKMRLFEL